MGVAMLILVLVSGAYSQNRIRGVVTDMVTGMPLPGAGLRIPETGKACVCSNQGLFEIEIPVSNEFRLLVSYVGYRTDTVLLHSSQNIRFFTLRLVPLQIEIPEIIVAACRSNSLLKNLPVDADEVNRAQVEMMPALSPDDLLMLIPGVNASRSYGIFNKTGDVILRGLNRNIHNLILLDQVPFSLLDGSASVWNRISTDVIDNIQVVKGPNSSLYGANAMGGVINLVSKRPENKFEGKVRFFYGTYNTAGGSLSLGGKTGKSRKGFYWSAGGFFRRSDGYFLTPDSIRESWDAKTRLLEYSINVLSGYRWAENHNLEFAYEYSFDDRGAGSKYYEKKGSYNLYKTHFARLAYNRVNDKSEIHISAFYKQENYFRQNEGVKRNSGLYTFYNTIAPTRDMGFWASYSKKAGKYNFITAGTDYKFGESESRDVYHTSTDTVCNDGKMQFLGLFLQDVLSLVNGRLNIMASVRFDLVRFFNGVFKIDSPTMTTEFMLPYQGNFESKTWKAFSPKLGVKYHFSGDYSIYANYSYGFRPPTISDMTRTGEVNKGFKLANPELKPEYIHSIEMGAELAPAKWIRLQPVIFYSVGKDFQYFVARGDSVTTSGSNPKPVISRQNVGLVNIWGAEFKAIIKPWKGILITACYTYNHSVLGGYRDDSNPQNDLTGKFLIDVPKNIASVAFQWNNRIVSFVVSGKYNDYEWADDENTLRLEPWLMVDAKIQKIFLNKIGVAITAQDIFNSRPPDSKGLLSPGRFFLAELFYRW